MTVNRSANTTANKRTVLVADLYYFKDEWKRLVEGTCASVTDIFRLIRHKDPTVWVVCRLVSASLRLNADVLLAGLFDYTYVQVQRIILYKQNPNNSVNPYANIVYFRRLHHSQFEQVLLIRSRNNACLRWFRFCERLCVQMQITSISQD